MRLHKKILKNRFAIGVVCVLVLGYTLYHMVGLFDAEISTFAAGVTTEHTTLNYDGYVFRDEKVLTSTASGLVDYAAKDGTKVARGQTLATVYSNNASQQSRLRRIDSEIALLEESLYGLSDSTDPSEIKASVSTSYDNLIKMLASGESGGLSEEADRLLRELNRMDSLWQGENAPAAKTLASLQTKRTELLNSCEGGLTYTADNSGYFYSSVDGFESYFTMSALEDLTGDKFFELISKSASKPAGAYGKMAYSSEWRLVLPIAENEKNYFKEGETYDGLFEENNKTTLPLTVEKIIEAPDHEAVLVVFSCDRLHDGFVLSRIQSVRITVKTTSGIYVPKSVVQRVDGMRGVYILRGSVVYFRQIDIIHEGSDYYLVKDGLEGDEDVSYLQVNDLIILHGKNLFDGRVVD